ncbi:hypothetical protein BT96DRAFT_831343 [Gymnopus androsaceus JB14]|uniref:Uncharacterized protein n=1 Tax=Gymnopus androsaceus JB14 TaxID=1447944 RepID=A0A6A4H2D3_9AGAR|nr:hypothetical protein BT96DRAFT_831343 [Gymnopus androsaceus JB14]
MSRTSKLLLQVFGHSGSAVLVDPLGGFLDSSENCLLVFSADFATHSLLVVNLSPETITKQRQRVQRLDPLALSLIFRSKLLSMSNHTINLFLRETTFLIGDGDGFGFTTAIAGSNFHDTVGVNLKSNLNLRNTVRSRRDTGELKLAEEVVVLGESVSFVARVYVGDVPLLI